MADEKMLSYIKQGFTLREEKCYKQAIEMFYKALEFESDNEEILFQLGDLYFHLFNYQRAVQYLEQVLKKNPKHAGGLHLLKNIYKNEKRYDLALECCNKLVEIESSPKNIIAAIEIYQELFDIKKISEFKDMEPVEIRLAIAKAYYAIKEPELAENMLDYVLEKEPENEEALLLAGKISFDKSEFEKSREIFEKIKYDTENPEILNYLGLFAMEDFEYIDAISLFSKASHLDKENHKYYFNLGNAYFFNGWTKEATNAYLQAIRLADSNLDYRYALAYLYFESKNFQKATSEVAYILSLDENHYKTRVLEALLKFEEKEFLLAQNILENNIRLGAEDDFTDLALVKVYKELKLYDKAIELINKVNSGDASNLDFEYELADINFRAKKYQDAVEISKDILDKNQNYIKAYSTLASSLLALEKPDEAKGYAQQAISLDMNFAPAYYNLALVREAEKDYNEAVECLKRAIMADLTNAEYYSKMSDLYVAKGELSYAFEYIKEAVNIDETSEYKSKFAELAKKTRKTKNDLEKNLS